MLPAMRQIWITRTGAPEVLELKEAPDPEAGAGQVRVRVRASGINFADLLARVGLYPDAPKPPCVVGYEVSGTVDQIGAGVGGLAVGDRVLAMCRFGGYSDVVVVPVPQIVKMPAQMTFEQGAAFPVVYVTAYNMMLFNGHLRPGSSVLIHSAAGGVGLAAIQIAKTRGCQILGVASASKHDFLRAQGCQHPIDAAGDYAAQARAVVGDKGVDLILDAVGGRSWTQGYDLLGPLRPPRRLRPVGRLGRQQAQPAARRATAAVRQEVEPDEADGRQQDDQRHQPGPPLLSSRPDRSSAGGADGDVRQGRARSPRRSHLPLHRGGRRAPVHPRPQIEGQGVAGALSRPLPLPKAAKSGRVCRGGNKRDVFTWVVSRTSRARARSLRAARLGRRLCEPGGGRADVAPRRRGSRSAGLGGGALGDTEGFLKATERVYEVRLAEGALRAAARAAFWVGFRAMSLGEAGRANAWLGRAQRLVDGESAECAEQGYLLLPVAFRHQMAGQLDAALAVAGEAAAIGDRVGDGDLSAFGRTIQGRALIRLGQIDRGMALLDESMLAVTANRLSPIFTGLIYCRVIASCQRVYAIERAREWTAALSAWCESEPRAVAFQGPCLVHRAELLQIGGAWPEALEEARNARSRRSPERSQRARRCALSGRGDPPPAGRRRGGRALFQGGERARAGAATGAGAPAPGRRAAGGRGQRDPPRGRRDARIR